MLWMLLAQEVQGMLHWARIADPLDPGRFPASLGGEL